MGREYKFCCKACGKESTYRIGAGRIDSKRVAEYLRKNIIEGKYGEKAREMLLEYAEQDCFPDPGNNIYHCRCGYWESAHSADVVRFVLKPVPFETDDSDDSADHYYYEKMLVKRHYRYCPRCNKRMKKMKYIWEIEKILQILKCPFCGGELYEHYSMFWD